MTAGGCRASLINDDAADYPSLLPHGSAVACVLIEPSHLEIAERLRDSGYRILGVNRYSGKRAIPSVRMDDASGIQAAVDYLVSLGHERISFLRGPAENFDAIDRLEGFRAAVDGHKLWVTMEAGDDFGEASGYAAAQMLLNLPKRPTALVCASDLAAIGAVRAASDMGLSVPEDLSVVGFGDFSVAQYVRPSLTTIRQCRVTLGRTAGDILIRLANEEHVDDDVLAAELVVRESTMSITEP
jgi:DNA-binding LacI/PurR family transcriptional regulator